MAPEEVFDTDLSGEGRYALAFFCAAGLHAIGDVRRDGEVGKEAPVLVDEGDGPLLYGDAGQVGAVNMVLTSSPTVTTFLGRSTG